jgi:chemotaxis protein methyltransferase CheR
MPPVDAAPPGDAPRLRPEEFDQIRRLAHRACGINLRSGKEELVNSRLQRLVTEGGFRSFQQYYRSVLADRTGAALARMIDALATNHTSFLREPDHFEFLRARAPELARRRALEVWSAGCSTGEEVWSLACLFDELLPATQIRIWGTDISTKALHMARRGVYPAERCRPLPPAWLQRHFVPEGRPAREYQVSAALRARVLFRRVNLVEPISWPRPFPIIFCRNVMIYFDAPTQEGVVRQLEQSLEPGGYLFIGHAESLSVPHSLEFVQPAVFRSRVSKGGRWNRSS